MCERGLFKTKCLFFFFFCCAHTDETPVRRNVSIREMKGELAAANAVCLEELLKALRVTSVELAQRYIWLLCKLEKERFPVCLFVLRRSTSFTACDLSKKKKQRLESISSFNE